MKYAIVDTQKAVESGMQTGFHRLNKSRKKMIVNENELALAGDPEKQAEKMGGKLINYKKLHELIQTKEWQIR
jgi:hypothetical protein